MSRPTPRPDADPASRHRPPRTGTSARVRHRAATRLRVQARRHRLRTAMFVRSARIPSTAQILVLAMLRRGLVAPDELFAAACPSETQLARCILDGRPALANTGERLP